MKESFRWYGPKDAVPLSAIRQAGLQLLFQHAFTLKNGAEWPVNDIKKYQEVIEKWIGVGSC